ncbi:MAG: hypothetical protein IJZ13_09285 [Clostridia bacterium]|nr:hypothetical protein [Clostridia bacterium]
MKKKILLSLAMAVVLCTVTVLAASGAANVTIADLAEEKVAVFDPADYGAIADDDEEDGPGLQKAMDAAKSKGGTVLLAKGEYILKKTAITIPKGVTLRGASEGTPGAASVPNFTVSVGRNDEKGTAAITMEEGSTLKSVAITYTLQNVNNPVVYSYAIRLKGKNCTVSDIYTTNAYNLIDAGSYDTAGHVLENMHIWTLNNAIYVDKNSGSGVIRDVHVWPFNGAGSSYAGEKGVGFKLGAAKDELIEDCFIISYGTGFEFKDYGNGTGTYRVEMSGPDCGPMGFKVDGVTKLTINQGQIMELLEIGKTNKGDVTLTNCGFWTFSNPEYQVVNHGSGTVTLRGTHMDHGIYSDNGNLVVDSCYIKTTSKQLVLKSGLKSAKITNNLFQGGVNIQNDSGKTITDENNLAF